MIVYYGGFWQRFVALSIDLIILYIFTIILFLAGNLIVPLHCGFTYLTDPPSTFMYAIFFPYYGMAVLLNATYFIYFHGATGQTPGMGRIHNIQTAILPGVYMGRVRRQKTGVARQDSGDIRDQNPRISGDKRSSTIGYTFRANP